MVMPPKENPVRRNARVGPVKLPAEGRKGDVPPWPLRDQHAAEMELWRELWATPQAVVWEQQRWTRVVARYCRVLLAAEELNKDALAEARQLEDKLGLTPKAMRMLMWQIASDEVAERRQEASEGARRRIRAVG